MIILSYLLFGNSIIIDKIENARIINSTSTFQSNCSTCICQCLAYLSSSSLISSLLSGCCSVNCYIKNNTCQMIISSSTSNSTIIIDTTSTVYKANCFAHSNNTNYPPSPNHGQLVITNSILINSSTTTTSVTITTYTTPWWCEAITKKEARFIHLNIQCFFHQICFVNGDELRCRSFSDYREYYVWMLQSKPSFIKSKLRNKITYSYVE